MLKEWIANDGKLGAISVGERLLGFRSIYVCLKSIRAPLGFWDSRFFKIAETMETDEYVTMTELQLEQEFGTSPEALEFIAELIKGTPAPHRAAWRENSLNPCNCIQN